MLSFWSSACSEGGSHPMVVSGSRANAGFTLIEIVVTMGLLAILTGATIISLAFYIPNLRLKSAAQEINVQIQKSRLEAIRRGRSCHVEFFKVVGGVTCSPVIWLDENANGAMDAGEDFYRLEVTEVSPGQWEFNRFKGVRPQGQSRVG